MDKYVFKPWSDRYLGLFQIEKDRITSFLEEDLIIEHVGSTAVPGLGGKGIIDIGIGSQKEKLVNLISRIEALGYEYKAKHSTANRHFFTRDLPDGNNMQKYHLHLTNVECKEWQELLRFRDYLITHPEAAGRYSKLKEEAAGQVCGDGKAYRDLKQPLIAEFLEKLS